MLYILIFLLAVVLRKIVFVISGEAHYRDDWTNGEKELEADERDRQREREELEDIRKKLMEEGHPDPDSEMLRVSQALRVTVHVEI